MNECWSARDVVVVGIAIFLSFASYLLNDDFSWQPNDREDGDSEKH